MTTAADALDLVAGISRATIRQNMQIVHSPTSPFARGCQNFEKLLIESGLADDARIQLDTTRGTVV